MRGVFDSGRIFGRRGRVAFRLTSPGITDTALYHNDLHLHFFYEQQVIASGTNHPGSKMETLNPRIIMGDLQQGHLKTGLGRGSICGM